MTSENKSSSATTISGTKRPTKPDQNSNFARWVLGKAINSWGQPALRFRLWDGSEISGTKHTPVATLNIHDPASLWKLCLYPDLYFGESYMQGTIEVEGNLITALETIYKARAGSSQFNPIERLAYAYKKIFRRNSLEASRDNIHHHYDVGNDFYKLWLDEAAMQYTCAYFTHPEASLEEAQIAKMDHVCRKLNLKPGETVVEAGCGWGGLGLHMAKKYGVHVKSYNISHEQILYARERADAEDLQGSVEYIEDDYRNITGKYDVFVSIGMLEHVGERHYKTLGDIIHNSLRHDGRGLIHSIGRNFHGPMNAWIEKRIFPNAHIPSIQDMMNIFEPHHFSVLDIENLRLHYAETLRHWLQRFEENQDKIGTMFKPDFIRAYQLYLAGSVAAFNTGQLQLFQVLFTQERNNNIARTRDYIYSSSAKNKHNGTI